MSQWIASDPTAVFTGGWWRQNPDMDNPIGSIFGEGAAYIAKAMPGDTGADAPDEAIIMGDELSIFSHGWFGQGDDAAAMPESADILAGQDVGMAYIAGQKATVTVEAPSGPPWPPGYPLLFTHSLTVAIPATAFISNSLNVVCNAFTMAGAPQALMLGQIIRLVVKIDGTVTQIKKTIGGTYANYLDFAVTLHDGINYGFNQNIFVDYEAADDGLTISATCYAPGIYPVATGTDSGTIDAIDFVAIKDGATAVTNWTIDSELAGHYIRGAAAVNLTSQGGKTDTHSWVDGETDNKTDGHTVGAHTPASTGSVDSGGPAFTEPFSLHTVTDTGHTHAVAATDDPASHLPASRVIDWIKKKLTADELAEYPIGTLLLFKASTANVPDGWVYDSTMASKFAIRGTTAGTSGADTHTHTEEAAATTGADGDHDHGGSLSGTAGTGVYAAVIGNVSIADTAAHTHTFSASAAHTHVMGTSLAGNSQSNIPPYKELPYIRKTGTVIADTVAIESGLHVFIDPAILQIAPTYWTFTHSIGTGKLLVGRLAADADFGTYGDIGAATHAHNLNVTVTAAPDHEHSVPSDTNPNVDEGGGPPTDTVVIGHTHTAGAGGAHGHTAAWTSNTGANTPASKNLNILKRS